MSLKMQWSQYIAQLIMLPIFQLWISIIEILISMIQLMDIQNAIIMYPQPPRIMQGWVSSGRNLFLPGHPEKSGRNLFLPVFSGQNWMKLDKTGQNCERCQKCWTKILIILNFLQRLWLKMHLFNWHCLKTSCKNIKYFWSTSSSFIQTKLE